MSTGLSNHHATTNSERSTNRVTFDVPSSQPANRPLDTATIDEERILTSSGRRQLRSPPPPSVSERSTSPSLPRKHRQQYEQQQQQQQLRQTYMSTPNLVALQNNEHKLPQTKADTVSTLPFGGKSRMVASTSFTALSTLNRSMKRSKSELILLSPEFRTKLMNEQKERDPLFYYSVKKTIGTGSMGSVALVKKRSQTVGGSTRKNVREAVRTHKRKQKCFQLPFGIGGLFRLCIDAELRIEDADKREKSRGGKNAILSIETWLGSSEGSSDVSSCDDDDSFTCHSNHKSRGRRKPSGLFPADDSTAMTVASSSTRSALDVEYAMKSIHLSRVTDDTFVQELKNEIAILKKLDHPHIVRPIETYHYKHQIFIVMEHCSGGDLYSRDPYTEEEAARIVSSILSAVAYLHANNVAHRDLKYENILFVNDSPQAEIKLIDFGLSKVYGGEKNQTLTEGVGTIYTMAPEVLKGSYTKQADVWSVGVITYMLLSSQMPFYGRKRQHIVEQILGGKYDFRGRRWRKIGTPAKDFVRDLLVVDPDERLEAERAQSSVWLNKRFSATVRNPKDEEIWEARLSMAKYAGYTKLKKMALMVVAHRSTCEEIGILRKVFQKHASKDKAGCITYEEFSDAWKESGMPPEDTRAIFDAVDLDGTGRIRYTEFLAATIEAQGAISEERLAEAFDRFDSDDSGYISVDNLAEVLGHDFPRQEIIDIIDDAIVDPENNGSTDSRSGSHQRISYSAFLSLWEKSTEKDLRANQRAMLGSQLNLFSLGNPHEDAMVSSFRSTDENQEAAKARATFLMDKHGTTAKHHHQHPHVEFEDTMIAISTDNLIEQKIVEDNAEDDYAMGGGIQI